MVYQSENITQFLHVLLKPTKIKGGSRRSHKRIPSFSTVPRTLHFLMEFVQMLGFVLVGSKRTYGEKVLDTFKLKLMGINLIHVRKCLPRSLPCNKLSSKNQYCRTTMIEYNHICDMIFEIDYIIIAIFDYITRENPVIYIISLLTCQRPW